MTASPTLPEGRDRRQVVIISTTRRTVRRPRPEGARARFRIRGGPCRKIGPRARRSRNSTTTFFQKTAVGSGRADQGAAGGHAGGRQDQLARLRLHFVGYRPAWWWTKQSRSIRQGERRRRLKRHYMKRTATKIKRRPRWFGSSQRKGTDLAGTGENHPPRSNRWSPLNSRRFFFFFFFRTKL